ncbi:hypothetical protein BBF96_03400 [Anoxybacter fermentans]|uniref:Uncharacterized protein n=1 Tax=Anoxybacter fermentans TaxID=1323375 RepID=A0A3S9SW98_9FIRM|nr:hypothetical protein [Anoxybacter fermentans]AZR72510.1 hypothetical protein BBF96_03400 [Anoxybacter fermentans]
MRCGPECYRYRSDGDKSWCIRGPRFDILNGSCLWPVTPEVECLYGQSREIFQPGDIVQEIIRESGRLIFGDPIKLIEQNDNRWRAQNTKTGKEVEVAIDNLYLLKAVKEGKTKETVAEAKDRSSDSSLKLKVGDKVVRTVNGINLGIVCKIVKEIRDSNYDYEIYKEGWPQPIPVRAEELTLVQEQETETIEAKPETNCGPDCKWWRRDISLPPRFMDGACVKNYQTGEAVSAKKSFCDYKESPDDIKLGDRIRGIIATGTYLNIYDGYVVDIEKNKWICKVVRINPISNKYGPMAIKLKFERNEVFKVEDFGDLAKKVFLEKKKTNQEPVDPGKPEMVSLFELFG